MIRIEISERIEPIKYHPVLVRRISIKKYFLFGLYVGKIEVVDKRNG